MKIIEGIDVLNGFIGKAISVLLIPMGYCLLHEVVSRYFFGTPTIWAGDLAMMMYGTFLILTSPYCLREGGHIRTDFLYSRWSERKKGVVDFIIYCFVFLPVHFIFLYVSWEYFYKSFKLGERLVSSPWMPIVWPLKFSLFLGIFLIILQGIAELLKSYNAMMSKGMLKYTKNPNEECTTPLT